MYVPLLNHADKLAYYLLVLISVCGWGPACALSTDKEQPIEVEADAGELDDINNITIYTGDVVVTRGSIRMTGDKMTVHYDENDDIETLIMDGRPATYRQLPDSSQVYDEAAALRMEYYELRNLVILLREAKVSQERYDFSGERIEYDTVLSQVKAWSDINKNQKSDRASEAKQQDRVKIIIKPKLNQPGNPK